MNSHEIVGRVIYAGRDACRVSASSGELTAHIAGAMRYRAESAADLPVPGDFVAIRGESITRVLPRRTKLSRRAAGRRADEQVLAANVDVAFLVCGLDGDFNLRRIERYLVLAREGGVEPVIVLNKCDLREPPEIHAGAPVIASSTLAPQGLDALLAMVIPGRTYVLLGSSGTGKSSILNRLLGADVRQTQQVRLHDSRGRHTTTSRELLELPNGAFVIDTPGLREIQLWAEEESVDSTFEEIAALAAHCRFSDCRHRGEPGCAVAAAAGSGELDEDRWQSYRKLTAEVRQMDKKALKKMQKQMRQHYKQTW